MRQEQIKAFLEKFSAGVYTEEEHQQFIEWLKTAPIDEVETIAEEYKSIFESRELNSANPEIVTKIEVALNQYELGKERYDVRGKVIPLKTIRKVAVAASIVLTLGVGSYLLLFNKSKNVVAKIETLEHRFKNDVDPGKYKAKLTLADGRTIVLDSTQLGELAKQGNTVVLNKNGQLVYDARTQGGIEVLYNTLSTAKGETYATVLSDGSKIWLNAASSIKFPAAFVGNERKVEITGEAYFEVTKDPTKKFIVSGNGVTTVVLGTHFNVNTYTDENSIKVTLLEGSVKVTKGTTTGLLKPGQQAQVGMDVKIVNVVDVEEVMAWKNGRFQFNSTDLKEIMRQIGRWYDVNVVYEGNVKAREFTGKISRDVNASQVLAMLEYAGVHFRIERKQIVVMQRN